MCALLDAEPTVEKAGFILREINECTALRHHSHIHFYVPVSKENSTIYLNGLENRAYPT